MNDLYRIAKDIALLENRITNLENYLNNMKSNNKPEMGFVRKSN